MVDPSSYGCFGYCFIYSIDQLLCKTIVYFHCCPNVNCPLKQLCQRFEQLGRGGYQPHVGVVYRSTPMCVVASPRKRLDPVSALVQLVQQIHVVKRRTPDQHGSAPHSPPDMDDSEIELWSKPSDQRKALTCLIHLPSPRTVRMLISTHVCLLSHPHREMDIEMLVGCGTLTHTLNDTGLRIASPTRAIGRSLCATPPHRRAIRRPVGIPLRPDLPWLHADGVGDDPFSVWIRHVQGPPDGTGAESVRLTQSAQ
ncbi:hypothetical protein SIID45300_02426 [Candidatus Magnetaquicoccaceae bacterium FCR-1]|uniref:Uncharacterized protein n=1 Tax=Candidatus Magnetaquiglobus chichijimensis TaxID=3141448 RepID=A0ABQ0CB18_9PROT